MHSSPATPVTTTTSTHAHRSKKVALFLLAVFRPFLALSFFLESGMAGGAWANYLEVGAEDTATLNAVINTVGSSLAIVVPYLGFWLRRVTGSWVTSHTRSQHTHTHTHTHPPPRRHHTLRDSSCFAYISRSLRSCFRA